MVMAMENYSCCLNLIRNSAFSSTLPSTNALSTTIRIRKAISMIIIIVSYLKFLHQYSIMTRTRTRTIVLTSTIPQYCVFPFVSIHKFPFGGKLSFYESLLLDQTKVVK